MSRSTKTKTTESLKRREEFRMGLLLAIERDQPFGLPLAMRLLNYLYQSSTALPDREQIELVEWLRDLSDSVEQRYLT
jgi:hypothetical protein